MRDISLEHYDTKSGEITGELMRCSGVSVEIKHPNQLFNNTWRSEGRIQAAETRHFRNFGAAKDSKPLLHLSATWQLKVLTVSAQASFKAVTY